MIAAQHRPEFEETSGLADPCLLTEGLVTPFAHSTTPVGTGNKALPRPGTSQNEEKNLGKAGEHVDFMGARTVPADPACY